MHTKTPKTPKANGDHCFFASNGGGLLSRFICGMHRRIDIVIHVEEARVGFQQLFQSKR
jgi:hypothetical protein